MCIRDRVDPSQSQVAQGNGMGNGPVDPSQAQSGTGSGTGTSSQGQVAPGNGMGNGPLDPSQAQSGTGSATGLLACGASINAVYEGDVRFEHCMALDEHPEEKSTAQKACSNAGCEKTCAATYKRCMRKCY